VFIGDEYVYKLKKPVDFGFLDFSTLKKRKFYTEEELRLNRRFSPEIYLGVLPVSLEDGTARIGDDSNPVEYLLKMKRIDEGQMLMNLLNRGSITTGGVEQVGRHLAGLYRAIESDERSQAFGSPETIAVNVFENFEQTRKYVGGPIDEKSFRALESWSRDFLAGKEVLFRERRAAGHIKDCHGDLHLEHVCLDEGRVFVFDCIEFNERFRFGDVASDVAFLSMDFDFNGRSDLSDAFVRAFVDASGDASLERVLLFYKVYRAYVRAKVTSFLLDDPGLGPDRRQSAFETARRYYELARSYIGA
jgi:aminoglycoside phosphotransferase family enzyme